MRGIKREDLDAIVDFLYFGDANVYQENLDAFLALAEELKLKGLSGEDVGEKETHFSSATPNPKQSMKSTQKFSNVSSKEYLIAKTELSDFDVRTPQNNLSLPASSAFSVDLKDLEEKVMSMVEKSEKRISVGKRIVSAFTCRICGKEGMDTDIKRHIESAHMEGLSIPCNFCDKQGCISCGILLSGTGARGVSSEHMENVEMFSENCALVWLSENRDLVLGEPCSGPQRTVLWLSENRALTFVDV